jgi:TRAP-type transport system small permease protein
MNLTVQEIRKLESGVSRLEEILIKISMLVMVVATFWQVFSRFVLGAPLGWSEELARYMLISATFIGAANALFKGKHINIDIIHQFVKTPRGDKIIGIVNGFIIGIFCIVFGWLCWKYIPKLRASGLISPGLDISMIWPVLGMVIGATLMALHSISLFLFACFKRLDKE